MNTNASITLIYLHFILSTNGPLHAAEIPQHNSLKSIWSSLFTSKAENNLKEIVLNSMLAINKLLLTLYRFLREQGDIQVIEDRRNRGDLMKMNPVAPKNIFPILLCLVLLNVLHQPKFGKTLAFPILNLRKRRDWIKA